ncbi:pyrimidine utilization protein A [Reyranella sp. MMS21-HV4-11]|uniref:Pyrimidine monooxygenase RutA n=1 Tax=Reyranella humidisoli TaxID=2849149 RepID=A0ABS6IFG2_9HYPH|nr:pyrimidine utilization protein A [Reyranella sp. MMS21-HV4-11]MBU8872492.1 pyrimidine utilization protein A [Reyranella sp. MMS21-HV4-11]
MEIGVFIPIGNNGWLISSTSPQYTPSFDLNREVVQRAERYGFDFAMSMIKLRGFGGKSRHWDDNLESFTLMAGLAAVTTRIDLIATVAVLTLPPAITARMAVTIDSISKGRFGVNLVTGWQKAEYDQMGLWPGEEHFKHRYEMVTEYVTVMKELWETGRSDFKGSYFTMNDCRLSPLPSRPIKLISAGTSDAGMTFAAGHCTYNFCSGQGEANDPRDCAEAVGRLKSACAAAGRDVKALALTMIIADETDEAAMAKWEHYKAGVDLDAIDWRSDQAASDKLAAANSTAGRIRRREPLPNNGSRLIGSYATIARLLDEMAEIDGLAGVMLTFDDFIIGIEQFGQRIQPLMKSRMKFAAAAS